MVAPDLVPVFRRVAEMNALCRAMRTGYLRHHPDAPATDEECELADLAIGLWRLHHRDMRPALPPLPRPLRARIDAALASPTPADARPR